jgi:hypothetical protein
MMAAKRNAAPNKHAGRGLALLAGLAFCALQVLSGPGAFGAAVVQAAGDTKVVPAAVPAKTPDFVTKVFGAATQGAVAACVAALLSAFTEPIVNRLLVDRSTVAQAIAAVKLNDCLKFFLTTFPTNMLKFPMFEVINMMMTFTSFSGSMRGVVSGFLFCTIMLPVTNYRFRKSMQLPIEPALLYQAYPPTVVRDILYGWARVFVGGLCSRTFLTDDSGLFAKAFWFGVTVVWACILSSPCNEWRGYWLQQPSKKLPFFDFFKPERYVRSTGVGATIMGISLMVGMLLVPVAESLFEYMKSNKMAMIATLVVAAAGFVALSKK